VQRRKDDEGESPGDVSDAYSCPSAKIEPGKRAVDLQNWAGSRELADFRQKWFFIGTDAGGKRWKGEAIVELVARGEE